MIKEVIEELTPYLSSAPAEFWFFVGLLVVCAGTLFFAYQVIKLLIGKLG